MEELKIYLDKKKKHEVQEDIEFEEVVVGEVSIGKIYLFNTTKYYLNVELTLEGEYVKISEEIDQIAPKQTEEVTFEFKPKITLMKPIKAKLKIKINYVVK